MKMKPEMNPFLLYLFAFLLMTSRQPSFSYRPLRRSRSRATKKRLRINTSPTPEQYEILHRVAQELEQPFSEMVLHAALRFAEDRPFFPKSLESSINSLTLETRKLWAAFRERRDGQEKHRSWFSRLPKHLQNQVEDRIAVWLVAFDRVASLLLPEQKNPC